MFKSKKEDKYYVYNNLNNEIKLIGNKEDFLNYLALNLDNNEKIYKWNRLIEDQNLTLKDSYCGLYLRQYTYFINNFSIININDYKDEVFKYFKYNTLYIYKTIKHKDSRKLHSGFYVKNKSPKYKKTIMLNSIPEYEEFVRKKDKNSKKYPKRIRRISCCWKDQSKRSKQYET